MLIIRKLHIIWVIWYQNLIRRAREAVIILAYAREHGFPHGDEEYRAVLEGKVNTEYAKAENN